MMIKKEIYTAICPGCGHMLKRYYRGTDILHMCSACNNYMAALEAKAKRIFGIPKKGR